MARTVTLDVLDHVSIASPCSMDWDRMVGDEKRRFCELCGLHVHNIAAMTRDEALELVEEATQGGRVCARFYKRTDGTVLTRNCPVGLAAARARLVRSSGRVAAVIGLMLSSVWVFGRSDPIGQTRLSAIQPFATLREWLYPPSILPPPPRQMVVMGIMACPSPVLPRPSAPLSTQQGLSSLTGIGFEETGPVLQEPEPNLFTRITQPDANGR